MELEHFLQNPISDFMETISALSKVEEGKMCKVMLQKSVKILMNAKQQVKTSMSVWSTWGPQTQGEFIPVGINQKDWGLCKRPE